MPKSRPSYPAEPSREEAVAFLLDHGVRPPVVPVFNSLDVAVAYVQRAAAANAPLGGDPASPAPEAAP
jgi:hypothetical protein